MNKKMIVCQTARRKQELERAAAERKASVSQYLRVMVDIGTGRFDPARTALAQCNRRDFVMRSLLQQFAGFANNFNQSTRALNVLARRPDLPIPFDQLIGSFELLAVMAEELMNRVNWAVVMPAPYQDQEDA